MKFVSRLGLTEEFENQEAARWRVSGLEARDLGVPGQNNTRERYTSSCATGRALQTTLATRNVCVAHATLYGRVSGSRLQRHSLPRRLSHGGRDILDGVLNGWQSDGLADSAA